ncbi:hypothetical protein [Niveibacterium sp. SC-1]|uniref:hypothetical protein n=1 Tax=Niveibacterium sp. SC-1 TaxID=3135646 RepID=UPI00311ECF5C
MKTYEIAYRLEVEAEDEQGAVNLAAHRIGDFPLGSDGVQLVQAVIRDDQFAHDPLARELNHLVVLDAQARHELEEILSMLARFAGTAEARSRAYGRALTLLSFQGS